MIRTGAIVALLAASACGGGKAKIDHKKVDAIVHKADACTDVACAEAARKEVIDLWTAAGESENGADPNDTKYAMDGQSVIEQKIELLKAGSKH